MGGVKSQALLVEASESRQLLAIGGREVPRGPSAKLPGTVLGVEDLSEAKPSTSVKNCLSSGAPCSLLLSPRQDGIYLSPNPTCPELFQRGSQMGSDQERTKESR